jgi:hypothetical protein
LGHQVANISFDASSQFYDSYIPSDLHLTLLVFVVAWQPMHTGSRGAEIVAVDLVPCTQSCSWLTVSWRRSIRPSASTAAPVCTAAYAFQHAAKLHTLLQVRLMDA